MTRSILFTIISSAFLLLGFVDESKGQFPNRGLLNSGSLALAEAALEAKDYNAAVRETSEVLAREPGFGHPLRIRAKAYFYLNQFDRSLADIKAYLDKDLNREKEILLHMRAQIFLARNNRQGAVEDLKSALMQSPRYAPAHQLLRKTLSLNGYVAELSDAVGRLTSGHNSRPVLLMKIADAYIEKGQPLIAVARAVSALKVRDNIPEAHSMMEKYLGNDPERYLLELTAVIDSYSEKNTVPLNSLWRRSGVYRAMGKAPLALADADRVFEAQGLNTRIRNEQDARVVAERAWLLAMNDEFYRAYSEIERVIASKFTDPADYLLRSKLYCQIGRKADAKADEQKVISLGGTVSEPCR